MNAISPEDQKAFSAFAERGIKKALKRQRRTLSKILTAAGATPADRRKYGRLLRKGGPKLEAFQAELRARLGKPVEDVEDEAPRWVVRDDEDEPPAAAEDRRRVEAAAHGLLLDEPPVAEELLDHAEEVMDATADHLEALVGQFKSVEEGLVRELEETRQSIEEGES